MKSDNSGLERVEPDDDEERIAVQLTDVSESTRRKFIVGGAATWATTILAGCSDDGDGGAQTDSPTDSPTPTPTATPTEEPTESPSPTPEPPENYVVTDDMGTGSEGIPSGASFVSACAPTRKFIPGMHAVWYVGVYDPETGEQLTDETIDEMTVEFTNRDWEPVKLTWAGDDEEHPADEWNGATVIPEDTETGTVKYTVSITNGDADFRNVGILANEFEIIEYEEEIKYVVSNYTYAISSPDVSSGFVSACGPEWQYMPGMTVAFAANIYDANTGKEPGPDTIDEVMVEFPNGEFDPIELAWQGDNEEHAAKVWESVLELPEDVETGTYKYEISVTAEAANVLDVGIATDEFTVINPSG